MLTFNEVEIESKLESNRIENQIGRTTKIERESDNKRINKKSN